MITICVVNDFFLAFGYTKRKGIINEGDNNFYCSI